MHDHSADILGNEHLRTSRPPPSRFTPQWLAVYVLCLGVVYLVGHTAWRRVLHWRERSSRLAMRRRHGIPDSDMRPFNVAYADAMNKRTDDEKRRSRPNPARPPALPPQREAELEQSLRHRAGLSPMPDGRGHTPNTTARSNSSAYNNVPANSARTYMEEYNPRHPGQFTHAPTTAKGLARNGGYLNVQDANITVEDGKKRAFDEGMDFDTSHEAKKSRMNGVALEPTEDASSIQRGEKRGLGDDEGEDFAPSKDSRGKRARQVSRYALQRQDGDQSMDIDTALEAEEDDDEITELRSPVRGKKRDRAEAGSTFGGDDDDEHIQAEDEKDRRRRRKRRTVAKRMSEASFARGKKRDAEDEDEVSDEEGASSPERHRRKSRRQTLRDSRSMNSDISMSDSTRSRLREIGEEWETNGVKYKIGPNYDKLRQALVKKARQKFVMPKDSQHPDRDTNLEVYVECWLTEEEYAEAKQQHRLAWQDSPPKEAPERLTVKTTLAPNLPPPQHPQPTGKRLLWSTSTSTTTTPVGSPASSVEPPDGRLGRRRDPFRESIANQPLSPFTVPSNLPSARRIASNSQANYAMYAPSSRPPVSPGANGVTSFPGSPISISGESVLGSPRYRTYSKWEKQELEANAMMRVRAANAKKEEEARQAKEDQERQLRERLEREKAEKEQREKAEKERKEKEAAASAPSAAASTIPSITVTPASTSGTAPRSGFSFGPSPTSGGSIAPSGQKNLFAPNSATSSAAAAAEPPKFSFGPVPAAPGNTILFGNAPPLSGGGSNTTASAEPAKDAGSAGGSSLLDPKNTETKPAATQSFGFGAPKLDNASNPFGKSSLSAFGTAPANPAPAAAPPAPSTSESAAPKFNFNGLGATNKSTAAPSPFGTPATNGSSSSLNGALGGTSESKPSGSAFQFKVPGAPASATANAGASAASNQPGVNPTAPKFSFNTASSSAPSPFGGPSSTTTSTEPAKDTTAAPKFSFNTTSNSTPSAFGNTSSAFGSNGASTTPAAAEPAKDAAAHAKPTFSFGSTGGATTSAFPAANTTTATSNPFGGNTASANPSSFGGNTSTNPSPFSGPGSTTSAFGKPASGAPSAFGTTNGSNPSGSVFGATSNAGASNPFGAAKNTFGSTAAAGTSAFGAGAANNAAAGTSSTDKPAEAAKPMFSFASSAAPATAASSAPNTGFSFGSASPATPAAGAPSGSAAPAPASGGFSFNFGGATAGGAATAKPSPFGAAPAANPFGAAPATSAFGNTTSTGAFSFGKTAAK
ncbi:hypothetical protein D9619_000727 [Psilocybe cf. subviscida]|uniref:Uncharacterized protein n=1 Tax=Psilocybe cf. subviscida TaxID=2480587 RepID=A0A8H5F288_9AGAR|nr:hypothetical protein D9619_000727 [Psilocybe cf. subviscida]